MIWTKYAVKVGFPTHRSAFFFAIRQYAIRKETLRWIKTATFSVLRSFERADFCHSKAKICRNTRLFPRFLTKMWRKDAFQNHMKFECIHLRVTGATRTMPESESFQRFSAFRDWKVDGFASILTKKRRKSSDKKHSSGYSRHSTGICVDSP